MPRNLNEIVRSWIQIQLKWKSFVTSSDIKLFPFDGCGKSLLVQTFENVCIILAASCFKIVI